MAMMKSKRKNGTIFRRPRPFAFRRRRQAGEWVGGVRTVQPSRPRPAWSTLAIRAVPGETRQGSLHAGGRLIGGNGRLILGRTESFMPL